MLLCLQTFGSMVPQAVTDKLAHQPLAQVALRCERWVISASEQAVKDWAAWGRCVCSGAWQTQRETLLVLSQRQRLRKAALVCVGVVTAALGVVAVCEQHMLAARQRGWPEVFLEHTAGLASPSRGLLLAANLCPTSGSSGLHLLAACRHS